MSAYSDINELIKATDLTLFEGYPPTGAVVPYVVHRPLFMGAQTVSVAGVAIDFDYQSSLYACGASVEAAFNLGMELMRLLQGARAGGSTLSTSMGYSGAQVEGHYESQVTVQLNQGGI